MARPSKGEVNVSQEIRKYLKSNKGVGPTDAAKAVSDRIGKKVSPTYVSNIKSTMGGGGKKKGRKGKKAGRVAATTRAHQNGSIDLVTLASVKELVGRVGAKTAHELIDLLA